MKLGCYHGRCRAPLARNRRRADTALQHLELLVTVRAIVCLAKGLGNCIKFKGFREYAR